ncbi:hypothetical protein SNE40_009627 [Patella caerulea]|uniref:Uncharacterized protein n=1 Tax=Patella caerulea TaxID=87958 RepID=A0AAN8JP25_PATCE
MVWGHPCCDAKRRRLNRNEGFDIKSWMISRYMALDVKQVKIVPQALIGMLRPYFSMNGPNKSTPYAVNGGHTGFSLLVAISQGD